MTPEENLMDTMVRAIMLSDQRVNGFCYPFCRLIIEKLEELMEQKKIFVGESHNAAQNCNLATFSLVLINHLRCQLNLNPLVGDVTNLNKIDDLINTAKRFLAIFETKSGVPGLIDFENFPVSTP